MCLKESRADIATNDVAGNFSVTLVDALDTFVVLNDPPGFEDAVRKVIRWVSFDVNTKPQVFETTIRVLGGLLSGHIFAEKPGQPFHLPWYKGELLQLAYDLGVRLLPAFNTLTGLPYARINLRHGVPKGESVDTCTAGAGSLILEFGVLSRLTGDDRFEKAAYKAFFALWNRRSDIGLVGNTINIFTGLWTHPEVNGIGAGIDSFYEYALKWYIMSGEVEFLDVWQDSYASVMRYSRAPDGFWYRNVNIHTNSWNPHGTYIGTFKERILRDITFRAKMECGLAGIDDLRTNARNDRMESFVLSETLKYLYLLFDESNPLHTDDSHWVFTTEGHILSLDPSLLRPISPARRKLRRVENVQCPAYHPPVLSYDDSEGESGLMGGVMWRADYDYARDLIGRISTENETRWWDPEGWCMLPKHEPYTYDFVLSATGEIVSEDLHPSAEKLVPVDDGYLVHNVTGLRVHIVSRLDGKGYDIAKLGPYAVKTGQRIYFNDSQLVLSSVGGSGPEGATARKPRIPEVELRLYLDFVDPLLQLQGLGMHDVITETVVVASTALFGGDPTIPAQPDADRPPLRFGHGDGVRIVRFPDNPLGCAPYAEKLDGEAIVVARGECTFLEKLIYAQKVGASGVVVLGNEDHHINPSADAEELAAAGPSIDEVAIVVLRRGDAQLVLDILDSAERYGLGAVKLVVEPWVDGPAEADKSSTPRDRPGEEPSKTERVEVPPRVLYLNNHPLLNTRLIV
ncbi:Glycoside Hydrolase Family 47 protein [Trametes cinnabarina]|uniref:alpha-1,2-Mannosidase n=1 Tax=Pycnoporus cinnabarinus TaxID=5643 RepID=A0A060SPB3_PYCCI|nr:Glycoside Hydrolase Family 47 protein [Trametes cinnabarina]